MTGGMRLWWRSSLPRRVLPSKWLLSILRFSVSTKVMASAASRASTSGRFGTASRRLAGGAVGCSKGLLLAGRGRLPSIYVAFTATNALFFYGVQAALTAFDSIDIMLCITFCSGRVLVQLVQTSCRPLLRLGRRERILFGVFSQHPEPHLAGRLPSRRGRALDAARDVEHSAGRGKQKD